MDLYAQPLQIPRPRDRNRDPRDPREPYTTKYTTLLSIPVPFPSTGSFDFRQGVFNERPMTVKEQNFEQLVNNRQAEHDISSEIEEWERLKVLEEDAIQLWQELDGNLVEYQRQMRTRDQQAMEQQCQRKKEKALRLQKQAECARFYEKEYLNAAARNAFKETVKRRTTESAERRIFVEPQKRRAVEPAPCRDPVEAQKRRAREIAVAEEFKANVKRNMAEFAALKAKEAAATNTQKTSSEVASATDGIRSELGVDLESNGESSHSPSRQQSGSADSVSHDLGSPSLPTKPPIDNTVQAPRTFVPQPATLPQSSQNSSNSASPPRSSSFDDTTPPSSKQPSPPESLKSSPPPTASPFNPDPAIWGTDIASSSSTHLLQPPSLGPSPQLPPLYPLPTNTPTPPLRYPYFTEMARLSSMQSQFPQPIRTANTNQPTLGEQSRRGIPTAGPVRNVVEMKQRKPPGKGDSFVTIVYERRPWMDVPNDLFEASSNRNRNRNYNSMHRPATQAGGDKLPKPRRCKAVQLQDPASLLHRRLSERRGSRRSQSSLTLADTASSSGNGEKMSGRREGVKVIDDDRANERKGEVEASSGENECEGKKDDADL